MQIGRALYCHATPRNDLDIFTERTPEERVAPLFADVDADVVVCGHTHMQFDRDDRRQARDQLRQRRHAVRRRARRVLDARPRASAHGVRRPPAAATSAATKRSSSSPNVGSDLVPIGRVGRPHGLDGSFFVEGPSDRADAFATGATVYVDGEPVKIVASKRGSQDRPVIRLERRVERGATLAVPRESLPALDDDEYYAFQLVGLAVEEEGGRLLGQVREVLDYPANDVLELDSGLSLPLVEACVRKVDLEGRRIVIAAGFADPE